MLEDDWEWIGSSTMPSQPIEPSHQASVDLLEIRKPTNCVTLSARITLPSWTNVYELEDQDCDHKKWIVCTINYGSAGLGASIGNNIKIFGMMTHTNNKTKTKHQVVECILSCTDQCLLSFRFGE